MSYKIGVAGDANSGKSYSRKTIRDGENVMILQPSVKASHLFDSNRKPVKMFDLANSKKGYTNLESWIIGAKQQNVHQLINLFNLKVPLGSFKPENLKGNIQLIKDISLLPIWLEFISKHLPWIHTVILPDFTHFISEVISRTEFINRRAGNEAYQKYWELAGQALRAFLTELDNYRNDLIIVTEYHTEYVEAIGQHRLYTPAGKMLTEKFKPETYYDVFLQTDVDIKEDEDGNVIEESYCFVTKRTAKYPLARALNLFEETKIPNDLQMVLDKTREYIGYPIN